MRCAKSVSELENITRSQEYGDYSLVVTLFFPVLHYPSVFQLPLNFHMNLTKLP